MFSVYINIISTALQGRYCFQHCLSVADFVCQHDKKVKVKEHITVNGIPSHSYGTSLAIWITQLPATRHK